MKSYEQEDLIYKNSNRTVWLLTIGIFLLSSGYTMIVPFLPIYLLELGVTKANLPFWSGAVFSISFLVASIMAPIWGRMSDEKGRKKMVIKSGFGLALVYLLGAFVQNEWQLFIVRALQGFANGYIPAAMTMITTSVPENRVGKSIGIFQTGIICGQVMGPLMGGLIEHYLGMRPAFLLVGLSDAFIMTIILKYVHENSEITGQVKNNVQKVKRSFKEEYKILTHNSVLVSTLGLFLVMQASILMLQPVIALYVGDLLHSMENAPVVSGAILSGGGIAGALMATIWGTYGQKIGYIKIVLICLIGAGLAITAQGFAHSIWTFAIFQVIFGIFSVGVNPSLSALVTKCTTVDVRGRAFGLVTTAQQFGSMTGPILASFIMSIMGIHYVFSITGAILLLMAFYVRFSHRKEHS